MRQIRDAKEYSWKCPEQVMVLLWNQAEEVVTAPLLDSLFLPYVSCSILAFCLFIRPGWPMQGENQVDFFSGFCSILRLYA
jgi:hypothetical protein